MSDAKNFSPEESAPRTHRESAVAATFGLSRDALRRLREEHMQEGVHWLRRGRHIVLTDEGGALLAGLCRLSVPPVVRALIGPPGDPGLTKAAVIILKAWDSPLNSSILIAYHRGADWNDRAKRVRVRVTDNTNFVRHMEVPCRHIEGDLYECLRPAPRDRGSW